jgi:hypothetical protein
MHRSQGKEQRQRGSDKKDISQHARYVTLMGSHFGKGLF